MSEESKLDVSLSREMELWHRPPMTAIRVLKFCKDLNFCSHTHTQREKEEECSTGSWFLLYISLLYESLLYWSNSVHTLLPVHLLLKCSGCLCKNSPQQEHGVRMTYLFNYQPLTSWHTSVCTTFACRHWNGRVSSTAAARARNLALFQWHHFLRYSNSYSNQRHDIYIYIY